MGGINRFYNGLNQFLPLTGINPVYAGILPTLFKKGPKFHLRNATFPRSVVVSCVRVLYCVLCIVCVVGRMLNVGIGRADRTGHIH